MADDGISRIRKADSNSSPGLFMDSDNLPEEEKEEQFTDALFTVVTVHDEAKAPEVLPGLDENPAREVGGLNGGQKLEGQEESGEATEEEGLGDRERRGSTEDAIRALAAAGPAGVPSFAA